MDNTIFATARDTNKGVMSLDGDNWTPSNLGTLLEYSSLGGIEGKPIYTTRDQLRRYSIKNFSTNDASVWHQGVMPAPQSSCVVAVAEGSTSLFYSFTGDTFSKGPESL